MCTYKISLDDALVAKVKPAFGDNAEIGNWIQSQVELLLLQVASTMESPKPSKMRLSQRLRGIAHVPADFNYKQELANRYVE